MTWDEQRPTASSRSHGNRGWRELRARRLHFDDFRCQIQFAGICIGEATTVDVVVPMSTTGPRPLTLADVQSACRPCHDKKTAIEASAAAKRKRDSRFRRPIHPADTLHTDYQP